MATVPSLRRKITTATTIGFAENDSATSSVLWAVTIVTLPRWPGYRVVHPL